MVYGAAYCYIAVMVELAEYKKALEKAKSDFKKTERRRDEARQEAEDADRDLIQLRRAVTALAALCGEDVDETIGITAAIRTMLKQTDPGLWYSLDSIKAHAESLGVVLADRKNPTASLLSALKRLTDGGEIVESHKSGKRLWKMKTGHMSERNAAPPVTDDDIPF